MMKLPDLDRLSNLQKSVLVVALLLFLILVLVTGFYCQLILSLVTYGSTSHVPAKYTYTVSVGDLNSCQTDGNLEILVPIPYVSGQQVFTDDELNQSKGNWKAQVKSTEHGKMLSLTSPDRTLSGLEVSYARSVKNLIAADTAKEVYFSPFTPAAEQSPAAFKRELAQYEKTTGHVPDYKSGINYSDAEGYTLGNTLVVINGTILKPEMRQSLVIDLQFEALAPVPDGVQPPQYLLHSSVEMIETSNSTYTPVVLSYGPFRPLWRAFP